ncbi:MAG: cation transporter [Nitrospinae bacterium]|nr:cation transporter [Nitrospinota bacterium]
MLQHTHQELDWAGNTLADTQKGLRSLKVSLVVLLATGLLQALVVALSGSAALLADTIHNLADAFTALPLWLAFGLSRRQVNRRFTYGYDRAEDIAGVIILIVIVLSAVVAGYESCLKLIRSEAPDHLGWAMGAAGVGFLGNEAVAQYRMRVGREIGSAALVADGEHARIDGLTSLAALAGLGGVGLGYPLADPIAGLTITVAILFIVLEVGKEILSRLMDAIEPQTIEKIKQVALEIPGVQRVDDIRARWVGHHVLVELHISVDGHLSVIAGHNLSEEVRHELLHHIPSLNQAIVHVDPIEKAGESYHALTAHHFEGQYSSQGK